MSDLIDRQAAIHAADRADYTGLAVEDVRKVTDEVVKELKQLTSAQPEIIRCKDCYWYEPVSDSPYGPRCDRLNIYPTENFYCAGAKLRGEQNEY